MVWTEVTANWNSVSTQLKNRFPRLDVSIGVDPPRSIDHLAHQVAKTHDLTVFEALEELRDWMFVEGLANQASDARAT